MASLRFRFADAPPLGDAVALRFGATPGVIQVDVEIQARVAVLASMDVDELDVVAGAANGSLAWGTTSAHRSQPAGAAWGVFDGQQPAAPAALPWGAFAGVRLARRDGLAWGDTREARAGAGSAGWGRATSRARPGALPWGQPDAANAATGLPWGAAGRLNTPASLPWQPAGRVSRLLAAPWNRAKHLQAPNRPLPGGGTTPGFTPKPGPVRLRFCTPAGTSTSLVLGPRVCVPLARIPDGHVIAARSSYVQTHSVTAVRLPDLEPVPLYGFSLNASRDAFGWNLQAEGPMSLLTLLSPASGEPRGLRLVVDGMTWEFIVESTGLRSNRAFGQRSASITARSSSVLLASPYMPETTYLNAVPVTAQQAVEQALDLTGVTLDWRCTDWLLPTGTWSFRGTPMAVARRVADSIGAQVSSPRTGDTVIIEPAYPVLPWNWAAASPDVTLALDAVVTEGFQRTDRPAYDGIYVSGQTQGVLALVKRTGTAPGLLLPIETDPLITHLDAARQRGEARLGAAGPQAEMTLSLPVLTGSGEPGVIDPGKLILVEDPAGDWKGLVRSVSVTYRAPELRQTLTVERHL